MTLITGDGEDLQYNRPRRYDPYMARVWLLGAVLATLIGASIVIRVSVVPHQGLSAYRDAAASGIPSIALVQRAAGEAGRRHGEARMVAFLANHVQSFPEDPATAFYLFTIARHFAAKGDALPIVRMYLRRALYAHPDISIEGESVHRLAARSLFLVTDDPHERIAVHDLLARQLHGQPATPEYQYLVGQAYAATGDWERAHASFARVLDLNPEPIQGTGDIRRTILREIGMRNSSRDWVVRDLPTLVARIKSALSSQDIAALSQLRADVNFFAMSWQQDEFDPNSRVASFNPSAFLRRSRVRFDRELHSRSNDSEAYLRTFNWSHRIGTWYLYFRRVHYPADPDVHGGWEWAGILFGEAQ